MRSAALRLIGVACLGFGAALSALALADDATYAPTSRSGSSQLGQGQQPTPAGGQKELQTPSEKKGMTTEEIMTKAKEKLSAEQYEAFERAMKKIDSTAGQLPEGVIDGANIPPHIVFEKGQADVGPSLPKSAKNKEPRTPAAAGATGELPGGAEEHGAALPPIPAPAPVRVVAPAPAIPPSKTTAVAPAGPKAGPAPASALGFPQPGHAND